MANTTKLDAALHKRLLSLKSEKERINVSISLKEPLNDDEVATLLASGIENMELQKRVLYSFLTLAEIVMLEKLTKVLAISLVRSSKIS